MTGRGSPPSALSALSALTALTTAGVARGDAAAVAVVPGAGVALGWRSGSVAVATDRPSDVVAELSDGLAPRWTWWSARETAAPLVAGGARPRACWDLAAVARLLHGIRRGDAAAVWAAEHGLGEPPVPQDRPPDLFELDEPDDAAVRADGSLARGWASGGWARGLRRAERCTELAAELRASQEATLLALPDPRAAPGEPPLALLTAYAESAAALLAVELEHDGLPLDRAVVDELLRAAVGERPRTDADEVAARRRRDDAVLRLFPGGPVDLRSPLQVRELLTRVGLDLPDTRSWRLEPHAPSMPAVAALLAWRKAERLATTYGWAWLDRHVGADGRLRGRWGAADAAAGRMSASAGLHSLPAELRPAVRAEAGHAFVRADLGQIEPRVLAAVSGDRALAAAAREDDLYAPVAAALRCDRPTAKIAVLAAMYGQTSGAAGAALRDMDLAYPAAMAYLRAAEEAGRTGRDLRTYGGRLLRLGRHLDLPPEERPAVAGHGRFARNAVVQGAAAELFKAWAATVRGALVPLDGRIVMCLHDELLVHVRTDRVDAAAHAVRSALASTTGWWAAGSGVRFVAEVTSGASWDATHPV